MDIPTIVEHYNKNRDKYVKRMAFRLGNDAYAEDIVQDAYEKILKYRNSFSGDDFDKWVNTILNNCLKSFKNIENGHTEDEFDEEQSEGYGCPHYSDHVMKEVYELIDTKSESQKEILTLHIRHEYTPIDISRVTSHNYSNCHKTIIRFRQELKELYG